MKNITQHNKYQFYKRLAQDALGLISLFAALYALMLLVGGAT
jgi:hypothetical protein